MSEELVHESEYTVLSNLLRHEFQQFNDRGEKEISPEALAASIYRQLDPGLISPHSVQYAALLKFADIARQICRQRQIVSEHDHEQFGLFELQPRYPVTREGRDVYVLRDYLTYREWKENEERLRKEGTAKIRHADAIRAEVDRLVSTGQLMLPLPEMQIDQRQ